MANHDPPRHGTIPENPSPGVFRDWQPQAAPFPGSHAQAQPPPHEATSASWERALLAISVGFLLLLGASMMSIAAFVGFGLVSKPTAAGATPTTSPTTPAPPRPRPAPTTKAPGATPPANTNAPSGSGKVTLYGATWCGACKGLKADLKRRNIPFSEIDVDSNPGAYDQAVKSSGGRRVVPISSVVKAGAPRWFVGADGAGIERAYRQ